MKFEFYKIIIYIYLFCFVLFYSLFLKMDITLQGTVPVRILKTDLVPSKVYDVADNPSLTLPSLVSINIQKDFTIFIHYIC